jgi:hypothetical protein
MDSSVLASKNLLRICGIRIAYLDHAQIEACHLPRTARGCKQEMLATTPSTANHNRQAEAVKVDGESPPCRRRRLQYGQVGPAGKNGSQTPSTDVLRH